MRVIGVLDLAGGQAVHAYAGRRAAYSPVSTAAGVPIESGDPLALARIYMERLALAELYAADLDAILGRPPNDRLVAALGAMGPLWLDAGISSSDRARQVLTLNPTRVIIALETLTSYDTLQEICDAIGGNRVAFSLDLRGGQPITTLPGNGISESPAVVAMRAAAAGVSAIIVIDLARVGTGAGLDLALLGEVRAAAPQVTLLAGGGVRGFEDLARLADVGCDGALVATALHDGRLSAADIAAAERLRHPTATR